MNTKVVKAKKPPSLKQSANKKWEDLMRLQLNLHGLGHLFVDQFQIVETGRKWAYDFADEKHKVAIEVSGGIWMPKGGHSSGVGIMRDHEKLNAAQALSWKVFQFSDKPIKSGEAIQFLCKYYHSLGIKASDSPF